MCDDLHFDMTFYDRIKSCCYCDCESCVKRNDTCGFQIFKRFYGELRGATLFLYKDDTLDTVSIYLQCLFYLKFYQ